MRDEHGDRGQREGGEEVVQIAREPGALGREDAAESARADRGHGHQKGGQGGQHQRGAENGAYADFLIQRRVGGSACEGEQRDHGFRQGRADCREQRTRDAFRDLEALAEMLECIGKDLRRHQDDGEHEQQFEKHGDHAAPRREARRIRSGGVTLGEGPSRSIRGLQGRTWMDHGACFPSDQRRSDAPMVSPNLVGRTRHGRSQVC